MSETIPGEMGKAAGVFLERGAWAWYGSGCAYQDAQRPELSLLQGSADQLPAWLQPADRQQHVRQNRRPGRPAKLLGAECFTIGWK